MNATVNSKHITKREKICQRVTTHNDVTIEPEPPPRDQQDNTYNNGDLTPVCVRIIDAQEDGKGITLYDAELIDKINDGNLNLTTQSTSLLDSDMEVNIDHLSTYINVAQQCDQTKHNFD